MKLRSLLTAGLMLAVLVYADTPRGTVPRATADKYPAHAVQDNVSVGATLLTTDQTRKTFASDLDRCCLVVEVALYPQSGSPLKISWNDFVLRVSSTDIASRPSSPEVLAAKLQKKATPPPSSGHDVTIYPTAGVGYESGGYDPVTGQRRPGGVYTTTGVGVGIGSPQQQPPAPGSTDRDRRTMELELTEKSLPEGNADAPVSGYLYFSLPGKKDKNATHQLEYSLNGEKVVLPLQ